MISTADKRSSSYYDVLEISQNASPEVVRAAYKSLIQRHHPDRNPHDPNVAERSALVVKAYQVLADPATRAAYDAELKGRQNRLALFDAGNTEALRPAGSRRDGRRYQWLLWVSFATLAILLWRMWSSDYPPPTPDGAVSRSASAGNDASGTNTGSRQTSLPSRTIVNFVEKLRVPLAPELTAEGESAITTEYALYIETIGLVVGGSDPDKYMGLLVSGQRYIERKLVESLARANRETLLRKEADGYLKQLILNSISETTNTKPLDPGKSTSDAHAMHFGVVEVQLPGAFVIESRRQDQEIIESRSLR